MELLQVNLVDAGYECARRPTRKRRTMLQRVAADAVLLDWMLPGQSGLAFREAAARRRAHEGAAGDHGHGAHRRGDRVAGLEAWVDDYVTKPFRRAS
jgi:two-component system phosphate regulon response regulator PhoB